jgi:hypothetical protein
MMLTNLLSCPTQHHAPPTRLLRQEVDEREQRKGLEISLVNFSEKRSASPMLAPLMVEYRDPNGEYMVQGSNGGEARKLFVCDS